MNNKHFGCLALGLFILLMAHWTNASYKKLRSARDAEEMSRSAYDGAVFARSAEQRKMVILKRNTIDSREYLNQWEPYIKQAKNAQFGEALINLRIKQGGIITLSQVYETVDHVKGGTIPETLNAKLVFEDDYVKTLNWLADLEGSLPAVRVSNCKLSKGQSGNDIKMELSLDIPIINSENDQDPQA
ncbi:MAG: hypothetical protein VX646_07440 [Verrucomicrobiota bacterium]|nr:hypothetical protein [Verrucomicrobiales bacterium]MEC9036773.1 hypothetical protein [Verrucomicrobiota bacterium]MEE2967698.1 hypothetical protein [Verrucomicrobiota bacterium]HAA87254.1 hypothetical protein [Verrucomicrobiales bacterium]|tara:strand:+ start:738 stop:1298 length:561 start_codon:yes stop_codon:yes gene_type:complete